MTKQYAQRGPQKPSSEQLLGKTLPANIDAERAVLGALLLNDEWVSQVLEILKADDFYSQAHRIIFEHIVLNS